MIQLKQIFLTATLLLASIVVQAQADQFHAGATIAAYGKIAQVPGMEPLPQHASFKISFDVAKPATPGEVNRSLDSAARFINMHTAAGVAEEHIQLAMVIHGGAVKDMTQQSSYQASSKTSNANADLIKALQFKGVNFYVCGQSAAYYGVKNEDLLPGVKMSLSAMTAHALLQQQGYTINPF
jgi:intracellular sulfur oxidation DsrE/DsrF family protein